MPTVSASDNAVIVNLFYIYDYCDPRATWLPSLVVSLSVYRTGRLESIPWWAHIYSWPFFLFFFSVFFILNYFIIVIYNYKNDKKSFL